MKKFQYSERSKSRNAQFPELLDPDALNLYRKLGFEEVGVEDESAHVRCDIRMEWKP